jgi:hypothetical protein
MRQCAGGECDWTFTTVSKVAADRPCSIWPATTVPAIADLKMDRQRPRHGGSVRHAGYITGTRFYKSALNTARTGQVTNAGTMRLATFTNESASGWQQMAFPSTVAIAANTTYVISYLAPNGHYSNQDGYFATAGFYSPPLEALQDGVAGGNGLYIYSSSNVFPTQSFASSSYFVDAVFTASIGPDLTPPSVQSTNPFAGASGVLTTTNVLVTFNEPVNQTTVTAGNSSCARRWTRSCRPR